PFLAVFNRFKPFSDRFRPFLAVLGPFLTVFNRFLPFSPVFSRSLAGSADCGCVEVPSGSEAVLGLPFRLLCIACKRRSETAAEATAEWFFRGEGEPEFHKILEYSPEDPPWVAPGPFLGVLSWNGSRGTRDLQDLSVRLAAVGRPHGGHYVCRLRRNLTFDGYVYSLARNQSLRLDVVDKARRDLASIVSEVLMYVLIVLLTLDPMLSHVIPCYPMLSHVIPCYPMLSHVIPCYPMLSHVIPCYPMLSHVIPCYPMSARRDLASIVSEVLMYVLIVLLTLDPMLSMLSHVIPCYPMLSMLSMLSHVIPCYPMLARRDLASIVSEVLMYVLIVLLTLWLAAEMLYCYRKVAAAAPPPDCASEYLAITSESKENCAGVQVAE
uniref:Sodium channel regulatory subunit beta-3 n=1 Tax=Melopsittacus undulatus TaxID=13146 RepID=A0A8V5GAQ5_MELUD